MKINIFKKYLFFNNIERHSNLGYLVYSYFPDIFLNDIFLIYLPYIFKKIYQFQDIFKNLIDFFSRYYIIYFIYL